MFKIDDNILVETAYQGSNNSIVRTRDGLVLIDSPLRPSDAVIWSRIVDGYGPVRYLINTDHHPDHCFGNGFLKGEVVAHRGTRELMQAEGSESPVVLPIIDPHGHATHIAAGNYRTRIPSITFTDKMTLSVADVDFELFHAPGHTGNTIAVYLPRQEVLFCGDAICEAGIPSFVDANIYDWLDTIAKIEKLKLRYLVTGHGEVCGPEIIDRFRQELQDVIGEVERRIDLGQSREHVVSEVTYEDRIHTAVNGWTGFPDWLLKIIIERSIERVYDDIQQRRGVPPRYGAAQSKGSYSG
jgi:cyclase